jgi:hypothetical protein
MVTKGGESAGSPGDTAPDYQTKSICGKSLRDKELWVDKLGKC